MHSHQFAICPLRISSVINSGELLFIQQTCVISRMKQSYRMLLLLLEWLEVISRVVKAQAVTLPQFRRVPSFPPSFPIPALYFPFSPSNVLRCPVILPRPYFFQCFSGDWRSCVSSSRCAVEYDLGQVVRAHYNNHQALANSIIWYLKLKVKNLTHLRKLGSKQAHHATHTGPESVILQLQLAPGWGAI